MNLNSVRNWIKSYYSGLGTYEKAAWGAIVLGLVLVVVGMFLI